MTTSISAGRPRRIDQLIPSIIEHDAVSNHTFEAQALLQDMGFSSHIYAANVGPGCAGRVLRAEDADLSDADERWILYQCSIGSPVASEFARFRGPKLLDYHNITPAELVERFLPPLAEEARLGRRQLAQLGGITSFSFADSSFNAAELKANGFSPVRVVPVLVEPANLHAVPDEETLRHLLHGPRGAQWLFVGQIAPHKAQHDLLKAFSCYRRCYDEDARLFLVGREMGPTYRAALEAFVRSIGLGDAVSFPGAVSSDVLSAYYASSDVFVCCSDHEGFCVPVIEAMARGLPVVAFGAGAIPETVGDSGLVLAEKTPVLVASAVYEVLSDADRRVALSAAARRRASYYSLEHARSRFVATIDEALESVS